MLKEFAIVLSLFWGKLWLLCHSWSEHFSSCALSSSCVFVFYVLIWLTPLSSSEKGVWWGFRHSLLVKTHMEESHEHVELVSFTSTWFKKKKDSTCTFSFSFEMFCSHLNCALPSSVPCLHDIVCYLSAWYRWKLDPWCVWNSETLLVRVTKDMICFLLKF